MANRCAALGDVAAYALQVTGEQDSRLAERHIGSCDVCADELAWLVNVVEWLQDVRLS